MINKGLFTSNRGDWKTPIELLRSIHQEFGELYDVSDTHEWTFDAFHDEWLTPWYCNPPYGREISKWTELFKYKGNGVALLPARTDTKWFHDDILPHASEIRFIKGRVHFDDAGPAPFPSLLAIFGFDKEGETIERNGK